MGPKDNRTLSQKYIQGHMVTQSPPPGPQHVVLMNVRASAGHHSGGTIGGSNRGDTIEGRTNTGGRIAQPSPMILMMVMSGDSDV